MDNKWWELPEMSPGQAADYMDGIRKLNENITIASAACSITEDMRDITDYNLRIENDLPFKPTNKQFVGMLGLNGEFYKFTK